MYLDERSPLLGIDRLESHQPDPALWHDISAADLSIEYRGLRPSNDRDALPAHIKRTAAPTCRATEGVDPALRYDPNDRAYRDPVEGQDDGKLDEHHHDEKHRTLGRREAEVCEEREDGGTGQGTGHYKSVVAPKGASLRRAQVARSVRG
jgi:hypothetical protein